MVTGVSGSGKSSLAFDTIYAEGQRRYIESLSAYARQFLERIEKPDVDEITGIAPAIAIKQKNSTRNPRSTVATATEIYDYLRLLYARAGRTFCIKLRQRSAQRHDGRNRRARACAASRAGDFYVLFRLVLAEDPTPPPQWRKNRRARKKPRSPRPKRSSKRWSACRSAASTASIKTAACTNSLRRKPCSTSISRSPFTWSWTAWRSIRTCARGWSIPSRSAIAKAAAKPSSNFLPATMPATQPEERMAFNERFECKTCGLVYQEPEPRLFSFNNPYGACPRCQGFGNTIDFDLDLVIPDRSKSLNEGAIEPWTKPRYRALLVRI